MLTMEHVLPFLELPAPCLRSVLLALWPDPRDLAALSCCCKATAELCADQQIWKDVVMRRYSPSALPGEASEAGVQVGSSQRLCKWHRTCTPAPHSCAAPYLSALFTLLWQ
jgi:hypothetical protein